MRRYLPIAAVALLLKCLAGCGDSGADPLSQPVNVDIPSEFVVGSTTWKKADTKERADTDCLTRFFASHQELAGSPELEGEPHLFRSGTRDRRFYWLQTSTMGPKWSCVAYENGMFTLTDGTGSPFTG